MKIAKSYRLTDHGIENSQYFQGHGIADASEWEDTATGIGADIFEAVDDALESLAQQDWDVSEIEPMIAEDLQKGVDQNNKLATVEGVMDAENMSQEDRENADLYYYVSIDVSVEPFDEDESGGDE